MSDFSSAAEKHKLRVKQMKVSHGDIVSKVDEKYAGGVCGALTMIYLSRYVKSGMTDDPFAGKSFSTILSEVKDSVNYKAIIQQLQQLESSRSVVFGMNNNNVLLKGVNFFSIFSNSMPALGAKGLTVQNPYGNNFGSMEETAPFHGIATYVANHHGLHFIKFPEHYVGAVVDDVRIKYKFLDVNYGQAITTNANAFKGFLVDYFASSTVSGWFFSSGYNASGQSALVVHATF